MHVPHGGITAVVVAGWRYQCQVLWREGNQQRGFAMLQYFLALIGSCVCQVLRNVNWPTLTPQRIAMILSVVKGRLTGVCFAAHHR